VAHDPRGRVMCAGSFLLRSNLCRTHSRASLSGSAAFTPTGCARLFSNFNPAFPVDRTSTRGTTDQTTLLGSQFLPSRSRRSSANSLLYNSECSDVYVHIVSLLIRSNLRYRCLTAAR
jgi:hypothetical protein